MESVKYHRGNPGEKRKPDDEIHFKNHWTGPPFGELRLVYPIATRRETQLMCYKAIRIVFVTVLGCPWYLGSIDYFTPI